jgi:hypothetical protein
MQIELLLLKRSTRTVPSRFVCKTGRLEWSTGSDLRPYDRTSSLEPTPEEPRKRTLHKKRRSKTPKDLFLKKRFKKERSTRRKPAQTLPIDQRKASGRSTQDS